MHFRFLLKNSVYSTYEQDQGRDEFLAEPESGQVKSWQPPECQPQGRWRRSENWEPKVGMENRSKDEKLQRWLRTQGGWQKGTLSRLFTYFVYIFIVKTKPFQELDDSEVHTEWLI